MGGVATKLVEKNTTIPAEASQVFSTAADNQTSVEIHVVQGERPMAQDNKSLGKFILEGIPPAPRGVPQVEVSFNVDANGILEVTAKDKTSGKENSIRIEGGSKLSEDEIKRMQQEAEEHADEDKKKKELIDTRNMADTMIFTAEKSLEDYKEKIDDQTKESVESAIKELKEVKEGDDKEAIEAKTKDLSSAMQKIGEIMQEEQKKQESGDNDEASEETTVDVDAEDAQEDETSSDEEDK
jgi:molecular chaperone DnaK